MTVVEPNGWTAILAAPGTYPRPVKAQRSRCESGAVPQLRCLLLTAEDEPGRLLFADELSPRRKGGSRGTAAEPPPSASSGGFLWSKAGTPGLSPWRHSSSRPRPPRSHAGGDRRRGSSRSRRPRPRICSRSARASRSSRSTTSRTTRRTPRMTKLSGYTPNAEAIAALQARSRRRLVRRQPHRRGAREAEDPGARRADARRRSPRPTARSRSSARRPGTRPARPRSSRGMKSQDRGGGRVGAAPSPPLTVYHELEPDLYSATSKTFIGRHLHAARAEGHRRRGRQDGLRLPAALAGVHRGGEPEADRARRHDLLRPDRRRRSTSAPGWGTIAAVKDGGVLAVSDDIASRWGPRVVDFIQQVAAQVKVLAGK